MRREVRLPVAVTVVREDADVGARLQAQIAEPAGEAPDPVVRLAVRKMPPSFHQGRAVCVESDGVLQNVTDEQGLHAIPPLARESRII